MEDEVKNIKFTVDKANLFREESITDMKVASIRRLIPVKADGSVDTSRKEVFIGHTQLMSPDGPLPIQAYLNASSIQEAMEVFPEAMKKALGEMINEMQQMQRQQQQQKADESRIIMPGR
ncbi:MAG: cytoplasmic protein [Deltaproteobacteria bacterium]|nr:cytoplasmic protein [Deltaproteobacteria bacterium]